MADDKDSNDKDAALWAAVIKDVKPLTGRNATHRSSGFQKQSPQKDNAKHTDPPSPEGFGGQGQSVCQPEKAVKHPVGERGRNVDAATLRRLRAGQVAIEGRLDLHGMNKGEARQALQRTLIAAQSAGKRCVLVITGKGKTGKTSEALFDHEPGVLKRNVPEWLNEVPLRDIVLTAQPAIPKHGGDGALYVYLRRKR